MKNMRKLIPAIAMLLVSAVMMSTASFAWFSSSESAVATGMQVKATAAGGLAIGIYTDIDKAPLDTAFGSTINVSSGWSNATDAGNNLSLVPTSFNGTKWYYAAGTEVDDGAAKNKAYTEVTATNGTGYYYLTKWQIKALADNNKELYVDNIDVTLAAGTGSESTTNALNKALRVALKVTTGTGNTAKTEWFYFAPTRLGTEDGFAANHVNADASDKTTYATLTSKVNTTANSKDTITFNNAYDVVIAENLTTTPVDVEMYIYYEGEDMNCITAYATNLRNTNVQITFKAE